MTVSEIRRKYLDLFKAKGHAIIPSASLMPENDPTTLFVGSGMQPLIPYLMGEKHPEGIRLTNSQKSFRPMDIEEVGDNRHDTFFEMLGNWSLGDPDAPNGIGAGYFKEEQLSWFFEFLTKELELDPRRLYVSVYQGSDEIGVERDNESVEIWKKIFNQVGVEAKDVDLAEKYGMRGGRIFYYSDNKNWWSRSGEPKDMPIGEIGGPDSEVFYDLGAELKRHENSAWRGRPCHLNCDCGRFIEIGNSVFIQFIKTEKGFEPLSQKNVDFGGGLERITMVVQGKDNVFETDLFIDILNKIEQLSDGRKYRDNIKPFEVIADHLKAATFIMGDDKGIGPSNLDQGYIVRRLIRRAIRYGRQLGIVKPLWTKEIAEVVIGIYKDVYPELKRNRDFVIKNLKEEEEKFSKTLERGLKEFERLIFNLQPSTSNKLSISDFQVSGIAIFNLYQTYGFPLELTFEELKNRNIDFNEEELTKLFKEEFKKHKDISRIASAGKFKGGLADTSKETTKLHTAAHLLLAALRKILGDHVFQKGSNITAERLRFDFSHSEKLTDEQKRNVEKLVNEAIQKDLPVSVEEMSLEEAKKRNAMGVFESKYGEKVKVYTIGRRDEVFSKEICGGPHVEDTGKLGLFKIKKEQSSSSGVRRIKAVLE